MSNQSTKERLRARRRQERVRGYLIWGGVAAASLIGVGWLAFRTSQRGSGEEVPIPEIEVVPTMEAISHVLEGTEPGPFNSDPPTSGRHYATQAFAGFYDEEQAADFDPYPAGYLVHSLEHGYVIFWYDCELLEERECDGLKRDIQQVMAQVGDFKVIGFPWPSLDVPVAMTSWDRIIRLPSFDAGVAEQFVRNNRNRAPEPNAP